jgi:integrase
MKGTKRATVLTDTFVKGRHPPASGRIEIADTRSAGLYLRIAATGARSWSFRFRDPTTGKQTRATIGDYPVVSLAAARIAAEGHRRVVAAGGNPVEAKRRARIEAPAKTFGALSSRYLTEHAARHKRPSSAAADARNLKLHILPKWKNRAFASIARADVIELIEGLVTAGKPTLANRVQALISKIFSFAIDSGVLAVHPSARLKKRGAETVASRVLTDDEIRLFWPRIIFPPISRRVGLALRLALLTGTRAGEIAGLVRNELENFTDPAAAGWLLPATRSKNGRAHFVPLSPMAQNAIRDALELIEDDQPFLFPSRHKRDKPMTAHALAVAMARFAQQIDTKVAAAKTWKATPPTPHDLRRTLRTRLTAIGIPQRTCDALLNHTPHDIGNRHYNKHDYLKEKRDALVAWENVLTTILDGPTPAVVVPFIKRPQP